MRETLILFYPKNLKPVNQNCEIANTFSKKMKGLMHRDHLPSDGHMLFLFLVPWIRFFWMKNVKIPLDIIFINRHLKIIAIYKAPVESGSFYKNYWSHGFYKYVVECNMDFCKQHSITNETKIGITSRIK